MAYSEVGTIGVSPVGVAIDANGDLLVTYSQVGGGVLRVDPGKGAVTIVSSGDVLNEPTGIAIDAKFSLRVRRRTYRVAFGTPRSEGRESDAHSVPSR